MQLACGKHVVAHSGYQRSQQLAGRANPAGQRGAIQIDAFAGVDFGLPVERLVVGVLRHQHMRQQPGSGKPSVDGPRRCRRMHDPVAGIAAQLRAHMAKHLEARPNILQHLGNIFAQLAEPAAAVGTRIVPRHVRVNLTRKMLGQGPAAWLRRCGSLCRSCRLHLFDSACSLQVFKLKLQCSIWRSTFSLLRPNSIWFNFATSSTRRSISPARELKRSC